MKEITVPKEFFDSIHSLMVPNKPEGMKVQRIGKEFVIYAFHGPCWVWTDDGWLITVNKPHGVGKKFASALEAFEVAKTLGTVASTLGH